MDCKTHRVTQTTKAQDQAVDIGIRNFAHHNTRAAKIVSDVDMERITFLAQLYEKRFQMPSEQARRLAELEYAAFVGTQVIWKMVIWPMANLCQTCLSKWYALLRLVRLKIRATEPMTSHCPKIIISMTA